MPTRKEIKQAQSGKKPFTKEKAKSFNKIKSTASSTRISERELGKSRTARDADKRPKKVTADNRKEVAKGSKASGVSVNGKQVRQGKVKAAEKVVKKAVVKGALKGARLGGVAGAVVGAAAVEAKRLANRPKTTKKKERAKRK